MSVLVVAQGLAQGRFVQLGPMPFSNAEAGASELDGLIYLVGGFNDEETPGIVARISRSQSTIRR